MSDTTKIEWTDATWNPITGCALVSEGCRNCYAARLAGTRLKHHPSRAGLARQNAAGEWKFTGEVRLNEQWLEQPLRWAKPRRVFVCAHGDLFAEGVPEAWIDRVFAVMALCQQHTFQVLTKRPERMRKYIAKRDERGRPSYWTDAVLMAATGWHKTSGIGAADWPLPNVWLGVSCEDQNAANARIPHLLDTPAAVRFVSAEPMLGPIDFNNLDFGVWLSHLHQTQEPISEYSPSLMASALGRGAAWWFNAGVYYPALDWIIVGGESGPGARDMDPQWARDIRDQCAAAGVAFFMKQMARKAEIPADLMVRQWPEGVR